MRFDGRQPNQLRRVNIVPHPSRYAEGSVTIEAGHTRVFCTASVEPNVPKWARGRRKRLDHR